MEATLTLHQAGNQLGVEDTTLSRLIRVGGLPEARKVNRPEGLVWVIPQEDLPAIARRNGWTIDLRDGATELLTTDSPDDTTSAELDATADTSDAEVDLDGWDTSSWNQTQELIVEAAVASLDEAEAQAEAADRPTAAVEQTTDQGETLDSNQATTASAVSPASPVSQVTDETTEAGLEPADDQSEAPGTSRESAIEVSIANQTPVPAEDDINAATAANPEAVQSMVEALDLALLERLLEAQEGRVSAEVVSQENKHALAALNITHNRTTAELDIERRERMMAADRHREERMARAVADAKVAELRDRLVREMALADEEKRARTEALARSIRAERDAANAVAAMGWRARRRYRKLNSLVSEQVVEGHTNDRG